MDTANIIAVSHISKSFHVASQDVSVLRDISFEVSSEDFLIIFGPSGCGKSTLLHIMLGLEEPTTGSVSLLGSPLYKSWTEDDRSEFRKRHIGMVYQQPNWIRSLSVVENVAFPLSLLGFSKYDRLQKAHTVLTEMKMENWAQYVPTELSSGQQQKVALARALITNPSLIITDEPTGNLDYDSGKELMQLLTHLNKEQHKTIVMVTHDLEYLKYAKTALRIFNGALVDEYEEKDHSRLLSEIKSKRGSEPRAEVST